VPKPISHRHRPITEDDRVFIRRLIAEHPGLSRRSLSAKLCEEWNWVQPNGSLRDMVCRGMMLMLHREGLIELPAVRFVPRNPIVERSAPSLVDMDQTALHTSLAALGALEIRQVRRTPEEALFNSLLQQHHYLGCTQPVGERLKYVVYARARPIAWLAWSPAPRHLGSRNRFIRWGRKARLANIRLLAHNTRFLILPWVRVPHLASHLLGRGARRLSADWQLLYGHPTYQGGAVLHRTRPRRAAPGQGAGPSLARVGPPMQMCDAVAANIAPEFATVVGNCLPHGRRSVVETLEHFPEAGRHVIEVLAKVCERDGAELPAQTLGRTRSVPAPGRRAS